VVTVQAHVHVIDATISEEPVAVHMVLKLSKQILDANIQYVHLEYIDVYQGTVQAVMDVEVTLTDII
tara:strand:+ start:1690 stop:1890 length:201 start_codon:yes stop_codon:yes gene_type:complete